MKSVYFIKPVGMDGPVKIGCSVYPVTRLDAYMTWSPFELEMIGEIDGDHHLERNIHECLADWHSHGEWFHMSPPLERLLQAVRAGTPISDAIDLTDRKKLPPRQSATVKWNKQRRSSRKTASADSEAA